MPVSSKPNAVSIRTYQVGFGDCFLLGFRYARATRYVLIDFGTTGTPDGQDRARLTAVAKDIKQRTGGKLHAVVATHRHRDHISGFDPSGRGGPGGIIASCQPDVVLQPWTEDPHAPKNATRPSQLRVARFQQVAQAMQSFSGAALAESQRLAVSAGLAGELGFLGQENLPNLEAVRQLQSMGTKHVYAYAGSSSGLTGVLPGVKTHVLGPPTLAQSEAVRKQRTTDADEFWQLQAAAWGLQAAAGGPEGGGAPLFDARHVSTRRPPEVRWFLRHAARTRGEELLGLVRILDKVMNNTSLILLFEVGSLRLLFPGDAQIENWSFALGQAKYRQLLRSVRLYKVGHHGSRNATPKSLWALFENRSPTKSPKRLRTIVSTMAGKHGSEQSHTEVPRTTLVRALKQSSTYFSTQSLRGDGPCQSEEMVLPA